MRSSYEELLRLDEYLRLPAGTSRQILACYDPTDVPLFNECLRDIGVDVQLTEDTNVPQNQRQAWKELMQKLGVSRAWWLDGNPSTTELPDLDVR